MKCKSMSSLCKSDASPGQSSQTSNSKSQTLNKSTNSVPVFCLDYHDPKVTNSGKKSPQNAEMEASFSSTETGYGSLSGSQSSGNNQSGSLTSLISQPPLDSSMPNPSPSFGHCTGTLPACWKLHTTKPSSWTSLGKTPFHRSDPSLCYWIGNKAGCSVREISNSFEKCDDEKLFKSSSNDASYFRSKSLPKQFRTPLSWSRNCIQDKVHVKSQTEKSDPKDIGDWKVFMKLSRNKGFKIPDYCPNWNPTFNNPPEIDSMAYQSYMAQMQSTVKPSEGFKRLHKYYTNADKIGSLERQKSASQILTWKDKSELRELLDDMKKGKETGEFVYNVTNPEKLRWKREREMRWKHGSVEDMQIFYNGLDQKQGSRIKLTASYMLRSKSVKNLVQRYDHKDMTARKKPAIYSMKRWGSQTLPAHFRLTDDSPVFQSTSGMNNLWSKLSLESINASKEQLKEINASKKYLQMWKENNKIDQWVMHSKNYAHPAITDAIRSCKLNVKTPLHVDPAEDMHHLECNSPRYSQTSPRTCYSVGYSENSGQNSRSVSPGRDSNNDFVLLLKPQPQNCKESKDQPSSASDSNSSVTSVRTDIFIEDNTSRQNDTRKRKDIVEKLLYETSVQRKEEKDEQPFRSRPIGLPCAEITRSRSPSPEKPAHHTVGERGRFDGIRKVSVSMATLPIASRTVTYSSNCFADGYVPERTVSTLDLRTSSREDADFRGSQKSFASSSETVAESSPKLINADRVYTKPFSNIRDYILTAAIPCRSNNHLHNIRTGEVRRKKTRYESLEDFRDSSVERSQSLPRRPKTALCEGFSNVRQQTAERRHHSLPRSGSVQRLTDKFESSESLLSGRNVASRNAPRVTHARVTQNTQKYNTLDSNFRYSYNAPKSSCHTQSTPDLASSISGSAHLTFNPRPTKVNRMGDRFGILVNKFEADQVMQKILRNTAGKSLGRKICFTRGSKQNKENEIPPNTYTYAPLISSTPTPSKMVDGEEPDEGEVTEQRTNVSGKSCFLQALF